MKNIIMKGNYKIQMFLALLALSFVACEPQLDDKPELGNPPGEVTFSVTEVENEPNTFLLESTTPGGFIFSWDLGNGATENGNNIAVTYAKAGDYTITLDLVTDGGVGSASKMVSVAEDLPISCETNELFEFLSNCDTRTWKLVEEEGAYWVGNASETWWQNPLDEVEVRPCAWNDEWVFNVDGSVVYDTKGDVWAEDYFGFNFECVEESILSDEIRPWASGTHSYAVNADGEPNFTMFGLGAFMGLPKATNGSEVTFPVSANTYTVTAMDTQDDRLFLEIEIAVAGDGKWRFRFQSDK